MFYSGSWRIYIAADRKLEVIVLSLCGGNREKCKRKGKR